MINKKEKANNLRLGAIYINANTGEPMRLINIVPCQGVWMEGATGADALGVKFEDVLYASLDEVQDFLEDLEVFKNFTLQKS